jgi:hypothetical protein
MLTYHCDIRTGFYRQQNCMCLDLSRADPTQVGAPERLIIRHHLKPIFFKLFRPRTELPKLSEGVRPKYGQFSVKFFRVWKPDLQAQTSDYSSGILKLLMGWRPRTDARMACSLVRTETVSPPSQPVPRLWDMFTVQRLALELS